MLGKRSPQRGLFEADSLHLDFVGEGAFYGYLARHRGDLVRDEDFAEWYSPDIGRHNGPPSQFAMALLLQSHDWVSDGKARARADDDARRNVAMGEEVGAKRSLQLFRAQLVLKEKMRDAFKRS